MLENIVYRYLSNETLAISHMKAAKPLAFLSIQASRTRASKYHILNSPLFVAIFAIVSGHLPLA